MTTVQCPVRIGAVSFLNTLPLIDGLDGLEGFQLRYSVPSLLLDELLAGQIDVGLCSSIDYQRSPEPLVILPAGLLGCAGPTLTVRLYACRPLKTIEQIYCDTDSHTSVALLRILLRERYDVDPELIPYDAREHVADNRPLEWPDAMLLIGDKVVTDSPPAVRYPHQLDLGEQWFDWTGRPFVFAMWMGRQSTDPERLALAQRVLDRQRRHNSTGIDQMIHRRGLQRGWPADLARAYLKEHLSYEYDQSTPGALNHFFQKALEHGLIEKHRPLETLESLASLS
jgi:chorismate dehydratase